MPVEVPAEAVAVVDSYLQALAAALPAARRARTQLVAEIADGLDCAMTARMAKGLGAIDAARQAVAEFGDPRRLAAGFATQLMAVTAHRVGVTLVMTGPVVGLTWAAAYGAATTGWPAKIGAVFAAMELYPLILAVAVPAAVVAAGGAGLLARRLAIPVHWAGAAALIATSGCVVGDLSLIATAISGAPSLALPSGLVTVAVGASVIRVGLAGAATRRIVRLRAASN